MENVRHYTDCLIKESGIDNALGNTAYTLTTLEQSKVFLCSFGISTQDEELDLPSLYWILKLQQCPLLLNLPNIPRSLFPNYYPSFLSDIKPSIRVTVMPATQGTV
jgi:hypothetical protein